MPINDRQKRTMAWESVCENPSADPLAAIDAANQRLALYGPTIRAERMAERVIRKLKYYSNASLEKQKLIREAVKSLKASLEAAVKLRQTQHELAAAGEPDEETPQPAPTVPVSVAGGIAGLELLPSPSDKFSWEKAVVALGCRYPLPETVEELIASIDIPLWIGERERVDDGGHVNLARPSTLLCHLDDSHLGWELTVDLAAAGTQEAQALYRAESAARVHARLLELGLRPEGYIALQELTAKLDAAYEALQPPFVTFERVKVHPLYGSRYDGADSAVAVRLGLTESGNKRRFINLLRARLRHGFDIYGRRSIGPITNLLVVKENAA